MYVLITWLCINLLHPLAISIYFNSEGGMLRTSDLPELYLHVFIITLLFSTPALLASYGAMYLIKKSKTSLPIKFCIWLLIACFITLLNFIFVFYGSGSSRLHMADLVIAIPGMITTALVILIRYKYFWKMLTYTTPTKNEEEQP